MRMNRIVVSILVLLWIHAGFAIEALNILVIGNSNTQIGHITTGLNNILKTKLGDFGSGYVPLNEDKMGRIPTTISVKNDSNWRKLDMFHRGQRLTPPHVSPDGNWIESKRQGAITTVDFSGTGIDIYWLAQPNGGSIHMTLNGDSIQIVSTKSKEYKVRKTRFHDLSDTTHGIILKAASNVTLLGADVLSGAPLNRTVCHKWGNGSATTKDYLNIAPQVFKTGLQMLNPQVVVILLGTNDHNIDKSSPKVFKTQLIRLIERVKIAIPQSSILLVSTFQTNTRQAGVLLPQYVQDSYPKAAEKCNVHYWDMSTWFGPFDATRMMDNYHCNATSGQVIADELFKQILQRCAIERSEH